MSTDEARYRYHEVLFVLYGGYSAKNARHLCIYWSQRTPFAELNLLEVALVREEISSCGASLVESIALSYLNVLDKPL